MKEMPRHRNEGFGLVVCMANQAGTDNLYIVIQYR